MSNFRQISVLLFFFANVLLAEAQEPLMPGIYRLANYPTPLYSIPYQQYLSSYATHGVLRMQTKPMRQLERWGVHYAVVSRHMDAITRQIWNGVVFLNEQMDITADYGARNSQTVVLIFETDGSLMTIRPTYGDNPLERQQNGMFSFYGNSFTIHKCPSVKPYYIIDEASCEQVQGTELVFEAGVFNLWRPGSFDHIVRNMYSERVPLYEQAAANMKAMDFFETDEHIFIIKDSLNGLWMQVEKLGLLAGRLKSSAGWVRKEDLYEGKWKKHLRELPGFRFEVAGLEAGSIYPGERGELLAIKVIEKGAGQACQLIADIGAQLLNPLVESLEFVDANFDGYPDIMSSYADGGAGPNYSNIFFLYDPDSKTFNYHEQLSSLPQVEVDTVKKLIYSAWRSGAGWHGSGEYRFENDDLVQVKGWEQNWGNGYFSQESFSERKNGEWVTEVLYGAEIDADSVIVYDQPSDDARQVDVIKGEWKYGQLVEETALWYNIKWDDSHYQQGWVRKELVFPKEWQPIPVSSDSFRLEVAVSPHSEFGVALKVMDKNSGKVLQIVGPISLDVKLGHIEMNNVPGNDLPDIVIYSTAGEPSNRDIFTYQDGHYRLRD